MLSFSWYHHSPLRHAIENDHMIFKEKKVDVVSFRNGPAVRALRLINKRRAILCNNRNVAYNRMSESTNSCHLPLRPEVISKQLIRYLLVNGCRLFFEYARIYDEFTKFQNISIRLMGIIINPARHCTTANTFLNLGTESSWRCI